MKKNSLAGKRVLILGGLGFIGSNLAIRLVSLGAKVVVVDSMLPRYGGNLLNIEPVKDQIDINFSDITVEDPELKQAGYYWKGAYSTLHPFVTLNYLIHGHL